MTMTEKVKDFKPLPLLETIPVEESIHAYGMRDGTPIEKGIIMTPDRMELNEKPLQDRFQYYTAYPDLFVDEVLKPTDSDFNLLFTQRVFLRSMMRKSHIHITAARGFSKTFLAILAIVLKAMFQPGSRLVITAPGKGQAEQIAKEKWDDLVDKFPLLEKEIYSSTGSKSNVRWNFKNGSFIEVTAPLDSTRGRRFHGILFDEVRDMDGNKVNTIMLPTLSNPRKMTGSGRLNPHEPQQVQIYTTSASAKSSYNYEKLIDIFQNSIIRPDNSIIFGIDYRVPVVEGLISNDYIQNMRFDPTFNEADFAREYLSLYTSDNEESWFNFDRMNRHRVVKRAEWSNKDQNDRYFYTLSADIGRLNDNTIVTVFKNLETEGSIRSKIVNIITLGRTAETKQFSVQARDLKMIIKAFNPKEVAIDINGLGIALADEMIKTQISPTGETLPPLGFINDDGYKKIQPADAPQILWGIKATQSLNSEMYGNAYSRINNGWVDFLVPETTAKNKLLSTKKGQKMKLQERTQYLMPYEMTARLFEEIGNLRLKQRTGTTIDLERINSRFPKDRFSSLIMGLYRIKVYEESITRKRRRSIAREGSLVFYTGGNHG